MANHGDNTGWIVLERPGKWSPLKAEVEVSMSKPMRGGDGYSSAYLILRGKAFEWVDEPKAKKASVMMRRGSPETIRVVLDEEGPFIIASSRGAARIYLGPIGKWISDPNKSVPASSFSIAGETIEITMPRRILAPTSITAGDRAIRHVEHRRPS